MFSIIWGIFGLAFINYIYIPTNKIIEKIRLRIPKYIVNISLIILVIITITDFVLSSIKYIKV